MPSRPVRWALAAVAFVALWLLAIAVSIPAIESDLTDRAEEQLAAAGIEQVSVDFDGRDGTLRGPPAQHDAALGAVIDRHGVRSLDYEDSDPAATTTTGPGQVTVPSVVTTPDGTTTTTTSTTTSTTTTTTSTTTTSTTTTTTAAPGAAVDASATVGGQTVRLGGVVVSDGQRQSLVDAATAAFTPQGQVVDELTVEDPGPGGVDPAGQAAVDALAGAITAAGPTLLSGTVRATPGALALPDGEAFGAAAADRLGSALDDIAAQTGVSVDESIDAADNDDDNLQATLDVLVGRAGITFAPDSADVTPQSQATLDSVAEVLDEVPDPPIEVRGHTDSVGPADLNQTLSEERAAAVVEYLVDQGVPADRLTATGAGETEPIAPNDTEEGRARNRRIELIVREGG